MADPSGEQDGRGLLPGVAAAAFAAAGVLALLRRRRRVALQQRPAGYRLPTPAPDTADELSRLEAAAPSVRVLNDLIGLLTSIPEGVQPVLATTTDDGVVTLLFDDAAVLPDPPTPWSLHQHDDGGPVGWRAKLGASGPSRSFGLPLLVTLGQTGSATVLANLGAIGTLPVTGPDTAVRRVLRTMSIELATTRTAGPVEVVVAGDSAFASVEDLRHGDDLAAELDTAIVEGAHGVVLADRLPRLLVCHAGHRAPDLPDHGVDGLVGILTAGRPADDGWLLEVDEEQTGRLRLPDGGHVQLTLPALRPEVIDSELDRLDQLERADDAPASATPENEDVDPPPAAHPAGTSSNGQRPHSSPIDPAWCEVRLLGPIEVVRDGRPVEGLSPLTLQVLLYLATHRNGVTAQRLDDAVWAGRLAPPGSQRLRAALTKLREALGNSPDGQPLLPRRRGATSPVRLSGDVGSDLDRALAHLARARDRPDALAAADEIAHAVALVRGEPFEGLPLSWTSEVAQHAIAQLQDAAITAAQVYREAGRYDRAEDMIRRGLRLCDPCEPLYIQWAQLEAARGRRDQIPHLLRQLRARYADDADETAGWAATPTPETELAFEMLMSDA
jgi:DNA-binding SARP family transcriptional activator